MCYSDLNMSPSYGRLGEKHHWVAIWALIQYKDVVLYRKYYCGDKTVGRKISYNDKAGFL